MSRRRVADAPAPITVEQWQALTAYRDWAEGLSDRWLTPSGWRECLAADWMRGGSHWPGEWGPLQRLRNERGPRWLREAAEATLARPAGALIVERGLPCPRCGKRHRGEVAAQRCQRALDAEHKEAEAARYRARRLLRPLSEAQAEQWAARQRVEAKRAARRTIREATGGDQ